MIADLLAILDNHGLFNTTEMPDLASLKAMAISLPITLLSYGVALSIYRMGRHSPLLNPVLIGIGLTIGSLALLKLPYERYFEGANVIFDTWVHPLVMGLEEHLLHMFRDDFEFNDAAGPSHHGGHAPSQSRPDNSIEKEPTPIKNGDVIWLLDAEKELKKIPFFVRGKARRNTETYAAQKGVSQISIETLYEAKAHYAQ